MTFRKVTYALTTTALLLSSVTVFGPASATAAEEAATSTVTHETSQRCLAAMASAGGDVRGGARISSSACDVTIIETLSHPRKLSPDDSATARRAQGIEADTNPVYSRSYQYTVYQGTDQENMKGTYYYDGFHVWQSTSYRSRVGSKSCWVSYSITYSIAIKACTGGGNSTSSIAAHMQLWVTLAKWTPISWREDYYVTMKPTGTSSIRKA
jgi:hypothetical protein